MPWDALHNRSRSRGQPLPTTHQKVHAVRPNVLMKELHTLVLVPRQIQVKQHAVAARFHQKGLIPAAARADAGRRGQDGVTRWVCACVGKMGTIAWQARDCKRVQQHTTRW